MEIIPEVRLTPRSLELAGSILAGLGIILAVVYVVPAMVWLCLMVSLFGIIMLLMGVYLELSDCGGVSSRVREMLTERTLLELIEAALKRSTMGFMMAGLFSLKFFDLNDIERARFLAGCSPRLRRLLTTKGLVSLLPTRLQAFLPQSTRLKPISTNNRLAIEDHNGDTDAVRLAVDCLNRHPRSLSPRLRLQVSALCRQALHGDAPSTHPSVTKPAEMLAWLAWDKCRGMSKFEARGKMMDILTRFDEDFANLSFKQGTLNDRGRRPLVEIDRFGKPKIFPVIAGIAERYLRRYVSESWAPWWRKRLIWVVGVMLLCSVMLRVSPRIRHMYDRAPKAVLLWSSALLYLLAVQHGAPEWAFAMCPDFLLRVVYGRNMRNETGGWYRIFNVFINEALPFIRENDES